MARAPREALGAGVPLIATRESNFGDWVEERGIGISCELSVFGVVEAVETALAMNDEDWERMRENVTFWVRDNEWSDVAQRLTRWLHEAGSRVVQ